MADFRIAYGLLKSLEGGYVNHPKDNGGETYKGIARNSWPNWSGWRLIDSAKNSGGSFPANLMGNTALESLVEQFYRTEFWNRFRGDEIRPQGIANEMLEVCVNFGLSVGVRFFQGASNIVSSIRVEEDGIFGGATLAALNRVTDALHFLQVVNALTAERYLRIVRNDPSQRVFLKGWLARAGIRA